MGTPNTALCLAGSLGLAALALLGGCGSGEIGGPSEGRFGGFGGGEGGEAGFKSDAGGGGAGQGGEAGQDGEGGEGGSSSSGISIDPTCVDMGREPNDKEADAISLGTISDCDGDGSSVSGIMIGDEDLEWFKFGGNDKFGCTVNPSVSISADSGYHFCMFVSCGSPSASCPGGTESAKSPSGKPGCCATNTKGFEMKIGCSGVNDDSTILLRLSRKTDACIEWKMSYHY